jgi:hypothetical protein
MTPTPRNEKTGVQAGSLDIGQMTSRVVTNGL